MSDVSELYEGRIGPHCLYGLHAWIAHASPLKIMPISGYLFVYNVLTNIYVYYYVYIYIYHICIYIFLAAYQNMVLQHI